MKRISIFALFAACIGLACTLTSQRQQVVIDTAIPSPTTTQLPHSRVFQETIPASSVCRVKTGLAEGRLNVRSCGKLACPVLTVLYEGDTLTITQTINSWLEVTTASGLPGWVNSNYCSLSKQTR